MTTYQHTGRDGTTKICRNPQRCTMKNCRPVKTTKSKTKTTTRVYKTRPQGTSRDNLNKSFEEFKTRSQQRDAERFRVNSQGKVVKTRKLQAREDELAKKFGESKPRTAKKPIYQPESVRYERYRARRNAEERKKQELKDAAEARRARRRAFFQKVKSFFI